VSKGNGTPSAAPRRSLCATALLALLPGADTLTMVASAMRARPRSGSGVRMDEEVGLGVGQLQLPNRWRLVHDCERPERWRETMDAEDCKLYLDGVEGEAPADSGSRSLTKADSSTDAVGGYQSLVPQLESTASFLQASREATRRGHLLVVKFYSKRCRACLRIAAKYRRLARKHREEVEMYEMEVHAAGPKLLAALSVSQLPAVQVYDGEDVERLASLDCRPAQFSEVELAVEHAIDERRQASEDIATAGGRPGRELEAARSGRERMIDVLSELSGGEEAQRAESDSGSSSGSSRSAERESARVQSWADRVALAQVKYA